MRIISNAVTSTAGTGISLNQGAGTGITLAPQITQNLRNMGTNESMDMNDWSQVEFQNFVKWFIEVHHPEVVEQYQAVRAIERSVQEEGPIKHVWGWNDPSTLQNSISYPIRTQPAEEAPKKSIFDIIADGLKHWKTK